jgi:hypothetical protein
MEIVYENLGIIIGFSVLTLLVQNFISDKASESMVLMALLSVVLVNSDKIREFLN